MLFCFLTRKSRAGKGMINLMKPMIDSELRIESFRGLPKKLCFINFSGLATQRENSATKRKNTIVSNHNHIEIFSSFSDLLKQSE